MSHKLWKVAPQPQLPDATEVNSRTLTGKGDHTNLIPRLQEYVPPAQILMSCTSGRPCVVFRKKIT